MFGIFKSQTPKCPVCGREMVNVPLDEVPSTARREFARLNRYQPLSRNQWYFCPECELHLHTGAVAEANKYAKYRR